MAPQGVTWYLASTNWVIGTCKIYTDKLPVKVRLGYAVVTNNPKVLVAYKKKGFFKIIYPICPMQDIRIPLAHHSLLRTVCAGKDCLDWICHKAWEVHMATYGLVLKVSAPKWNTSVSVTIGCETLQFQGQNSAAVTIHWSVHAAYMYIYTYIYMTNLKGAEKCNLTSLGGKKRLCK